MDVGLAMTARNHPDYPRPLTEIYREVLDEAVLGEQLGFRSWWLAEHHFAEDQHNPSQFPLLAAAAARTSAIRIGSYVLLLPLHNPLRVAEDAATVDILSNGRLELAIGAGPMPGECAVFGMDPKESFGRTYEALEVIGKCFTEEEFSHQGKYFTLRERADDDQAGAAARPAHLPGRARPAEPDQGRGARLQPRLHGAHAALPAVPGGAGRGGPHPGRLPAAVRPARRARRADPGAGLGRGRARAALVGRVLPAARHADAAGPGR